MKSLTIYGVHPCEEFVQQAPEQILVGYANDWDSRALAPIAVLLDAAGVKREQVHVRQIDKLADGGNHQGVLLHVAPFEYAMWDDVLATLGDRKRACVLILDQVQDPGNFGAMLRSAAAFGVDAVVVQDRRAAPMTAAVIKASAGQAWRVPIVQVKNVSHAIEELAEHGFWSVTTDVREGSAPWTLDLNMKVALVLGGEHKGVRRLVAKRCDMKMCVPLQDGVESLNVSTATAVALYEVRRQWQISGNEN